MAQATGQKKPVMEAKEVKRDFYQFVINGERTDSSLRRNFYNI